MVARKYDDLVPTWVSDYENGLSVWDIGSKYGVSGQSVWGKLKQTGVTFRTKQVSIRKHGLRLNAFSGVLSHEACYWLGLLYADGCLQHKNGSYSVSLVAHLDDVESLEAFSLFLGTHKPLSYRKDKKAVTLVITSKQLGADLLALGVTPRKAHTIQFPNFLPSEKRRHFIRGFFDGDGCVVFRHKARYITPQGIVSMTTNLQMARGIAEAIREDIGISQTGIRPANGGRSFVLSYEGRNKLIAIRDYFYEDSGPCLSRKKERFSVLSAEASARALIHQELRSFIPL